MGMTLDQTVLDGLVQRLILKTDGDNRKPVEKAEITFSGGQSCLAYVLRLVDNQIFFSSKLTRQGNIRMEDEFYEDIRNINDYRVIN